MVIFLPTPSLQVIDVVNMFPNIDTVKGVADVTNKLEQRKTKNPPTRCIIEALLLCLECNNTSFYNKNYLQVDGTAQGPHMACSYSDIAMDRYDQEALRAPIPPYFWFRYHDDIYLVWIHSLEDLHQFVA